MSFSDTARETTPETAVSERPELRDLDEVLAYIRETVGGGMTGVLGFSITVKKEKSTLNLKWGDLRLRRFKGGFNG